MQIFEISGGLNFLGKRVFVNIIFFRSGVSIAIIQTAGLGTQTGVHIQVIIHLLFMVKNRDLENGALTLILIHYLN